MTGHGRVTSLALALALGSAPGVWSDGPLANEIPSAARRDPEALRPAVDAAVEKVLPALVNLTIVSQRYADGRAQRFRVAGSGVVATPQGHVLTNYHVAGDSIRIRGTLSTGEVLDGEVVLHDPATDLSVLRLVPRSPRRFAYAELDRRVALKVGDPVLAIGNPFALASSVTLGIVSNPRRVFTDAAGTELVPVDLGAGEAAGTLTPWIQHDALILPGNSGGPLVDLAGRVVGINELGGSGLGFAIPAPVAAEVLAQALEQGEVRRAWLGLSVLPVDKLGRDQGALVAAVVEGSPAARGGLLAGDIVLGLDGHPVAVRFFEELPAFSQRVASLPIGRKVPVEIERAGVRRQLELLTEPMERGRGSEAEFRSLGLTAQEVTGPMVLANRLAAKEGLLVTGLRSGAPASRARPQLQPGDVLLVAGGVPLARLEDLTAALEKADRSAPLLLELRRGRESVLATVQLEVPPGRLWGGELPRAWLGLRTQVVTPEIATALGLAERRGFRVTEVYDGGAAKRAGLATGDILTALDGEPLSAARVQESEDLQHRIEERSIGSAVRFDLLRHTSTGMSAMQLAVELEARPEDPGQARLERDDELEIAARDLTAFDRLRLHVGEEQRGALVVEATSGGWAQLAGLRTDDIVLRAGGRNVSDAASLMKALAALRAERTCTVELFVRRGSLTQFLFLEPVRPGEPCRDAQSSSPSSSSN